MKLEGHLQITGNVEAANLSGTNTGDQHGFYGIVVKDDVNVVVTDSIHFSGPDFVVSSSGDGAFVQLDEILTAEAFYLKGGGEFSNDDSNNTLLHGGGDLSITSDGAVDVTGTSTASVTSGTGALTLTSGTGDMVLSAAGGASDIDASDAAQIIVPAGTASAAGIEFGGTFGFAGLFSSAFGVSVRSVGSTALEIGGSNIETDRRFLIGDGTAAFPSFAASARPTEGFSFATGEININLGGITRLKTGKKGVWAEKQMEAEAFYMHNGVDLAEDEKSISIRWPSRDTNVTWFVPGDDITVQKIHANLLAKDSGFYPYVDWSVYYDTLRTHDGGTELITDGTRTGFYPSTNAHVITSFDNPNIPKDNYVWVRTTDLGEGAGAEEELHLTMHFRRGS